MILSEINIYPIKSLGGISLEKSLIEDRGLKFDRRWMLVDTNNKLLTQREVPKMATIGVSVNKDSLKIFHKSEKLEIPFDFIEEKLEKVTIWDTCVSAKFYGKKINEWFSDILQTECFLVVMPDKTKRLVNPIYAVKKFRDTVSFADGFPFLLIGHSSLDDLNSRLEKPVPMNRFRPNFVIKGSEAFAEDTWKKIRIGETLFHLVKPCSRCVLTTVNQATGKKEGREPLKTLATFRSKQNKILFGQNLIAEKAGDFVNVGDKVEILETI